MIRGEYDALFEARTGHDVGREFDLAGVDGDDGPPTLPQLLDPQVYAPALRNTLYEANALSCARQLIGPAAEYMLSHGNTHTERSTTVGSGIKLLVVVLSRHVGSMGS